MKIKKKKKLTTSFQLWSQIINEHVLAQTITYGSVSNKRRVYSCFTGFETREKDAMATNFSIPASSIPFGDSAALANRNPTSSTQL